MDSYLELAEAVLRTEKRPLTPKGIITAGYRSGLVPTHLHGKTQHKTLGARVSEDILKRRDQSAFFRTAPGRFFVREYLTDHTIPENFRIPFLARRRVRDLIQGPVLFANNRENIECIINQESTDYLSRLVESNCFIFCEPSVQPANCMQVWSFVCVVKDDHILTYRLGRYRDNRDSFALKRSIGFKSTVSINDADLFNQTTLGIIDAGVWGVMADLDMPLGAPRAGLPTTATKLHSFICSDYGDYPVLLAVILMTCPDWFEPLKRRLALNDLSWLSLSNRVNDIDDFDPWSKAVLKKSFYPVERDDVQNNKIDRRT